MGMEDGVPDELKLKWRESVQEERRRIFGALFIPKLGVYIRQQAPLGDMREYLDEQFEARKK
jgi:hypothetical protein